MQALVGQKADSCAIRLQLSLQNMPQIAMVFFLLKIAIFCSNCGGIFDTLSQEHILQCSAVVGQEVTSCAIRLQLSKLFGYLAVFDKHGQEEYP